MTTPVSEIRRYWGFAEEATRGTPEASAEMHCDAKTLNPGFPDNPEMIFEGSMGRGKNIHRPGSFIISPSAEVGTDIRILTRQLMFALGGETIDVTEGAGTGVNPTRVYYYDSSASTYTSDLTDFTDADANDVDIPGHAEAEINDALYVGYTNTFETINITTGTGKTDTSTLVWEYWDGDSWATLSVTDGTSGFTLTGAKTITWTAPTDWAVKSVNRTTAIYYVRCRCSAFTSAGTRGLVTKGTLDTDPDTSVHYIHGTHDVMLPSQTQFMGMDINEHILSGCVTDKLELTADDKFLMLKVDSKGQTPTSTTLKDIDDLTINDDYPLAYYEVDLHMRTYGSSTSWGAGTLISEDVKKVTLTIENNISDKDGMRIGSRFAGYLPAGERNVELGFDYTYLTEDWIEKLWGSSGGPQEDSTSTEFELLLSIDAGVYGSMTIYLPRCIVTAAPLSTSGKDPVIQGVKVSAFQRDITIPATPTEDVTTEILVTSTLNWTDSTGGFDGSAWAAAT